MPSPSTTAPVRTRQESDASGGEPEHYEPEIHFEPVIPLPQLIEVSTGEEGEQVHIYLFKIFMTLFQSRFTSRAKLYRWEGSTNEWKERGVGDLKVRWTI